MWLLSVNTCRSWEVCVWWEVFVSQLITGNTHRQIPNSKDLICITLSICTPAPSFQQHPWGANSNSLGVPPARSPGNEDWAVFHAPTPNILPEIPSSKKTAGY